MRYFDYVRFNVYSRNIKTNATEKKYALDTFDMALLHHQALLLGYDQIADLLLELMVGNCNLFIIEDIDALAHIASSAYQFEDDDSKDYEPSISYSAYSFFESLVPYQGLSSLVFMREEVDGL